jgi:uncharacterized repeat protein (TIGR01451 family)
VQMKTAFGRGTRVRAGRSRRRARGAQVRAVLVATAMLAVFILAGSRSGNAAIGDPTIAADTTTTVVADTTTTLVADTTTTVVADTTTTTVVADTTTTTTVVADTTTTTVVADTTTTVVADPTTTIAAPSTSAVTTSTLPPTTTTAPPPVKQCVPNVSACLQHSATAQFQDVNGNLLLDAGDVVTYTVSLGAVASGVTTPVFSFGMPAGVGNTFTALTYNGVALTAAAGDDAGELSASTATVRLPSPLPGTAVISVAFTLGGGVPVLASLAAPGIVLQDQLRAFDLTDVVVSGATPITLAVSEKLANLNLNLSTIVADWPTINGMTRFKAVVSNGGPDTVASAVLTLDLPALADLANVELPSGCVRTGAQVRCAIGRVDVVGAGAPAERIIGFRLLPLAAPGSTITVAASVTSEVFDSDTANNSRSVDATLDLPTDLGVSLPDLPLTWVAGTVHPFTVHVVNDGVTAAHNVRVTVGVPQAVKLVSAPECQDRDALTGRVTCTIPLLVGTSGYDIVFAKSKIDLNETRGSLAFDATVATNPPSLDPILPNNTAGPIAVAVAGSADLSVVFTDVPDTATAGRRFTITGEVANGGISLSGDVQIVLEGNELVSGLTATLSGVPCVAGTAGRVVCYATAMVPGKVRTLVINASAISSATSGTGAVTASIRSASIDVADPDLTNNGVTARIEFHGFADLRTVVHAPTAALAGLPVRFTADVVNDGPSDAISVTVTVGVSAAFQRAVVTSEDGSTTCSEVVAGAATCGRLNISAGESRTFVITGATSPDEAVRSSVSVRASAAGTTEDPVTTNDVGFGEVLVSLDSTLGLRILATPTGRIIAGEAVSYDVIVTNTGRTRTDRASIAISKPEGFRGASPTGCADEGAQWLCVTAPIPAGSTAAYYVRGKAASGLAAGATFTLGAVVTDSTPLTEPRGDSASAQIVVQSSVTVTPFFDATVIAGKSLPLTYTVANDGPSDAQDVAVVLTLPVGMQVQPAAGCSPAGADTLRCVVGVMVAGTTVTFNIGVGTDPALADGSSLEIRHRLSWNDQTAADVRSIRVQARADLSLVLQAPDHAIAGRTMTATFTLNNDGPSLSRNVSFSVPASDLVGAVATSVSGPGLVCTVNRLRVDCTIVTLVPGASVALTLQLDVREDAVDPGEITAEVSVASGTVDPRLTNNAVSLRVPVSSEADVVVTLEAPTELKAGAVATVTITVRNAGPSTARNVRVPVTPPPNLSSLVVAGGGLSCQGTGTRQQMLCDIGDLANGGVVKLVLQAVLDVNTVDGLDVPFEVSATSSTLDPFLGSNGSASSSKMVGRATSRREASDPTALTRTQRVVVLGADITNPLDRPVQDVVFVQDVIAGQKAMAVSSSQGRCKISVLTVLCEIGTIAPNQTVKVRVRTAVNVAPLNTPLITMSAYRSAEFPLTFAKTADDENFVRPIIGSPVLLNVTAISPLPVPKLATANAPLFSGVMLSALFGLGLVGWVRKGRREDPLLALIG